MYRVSFELYKHEWKFGRTRNAVVISHLVPEIFKIFCIVQNYPYPPPGGKELRERDDVIRCDKKSKHKVLREYLCK